MSLWGQRDTFGATLNACLIVWQRCRFRRISLFVVVYAAVADRVVVVDILAVGIAALLCRVTAESQSQSPSPSQSQRESSVFLHSSWQ